MGVAGLLGSGFTSADTLAWTIRRRGNVADRVKQLTITLDGPGIGEFTVAVDDLTAVLTGVQDALRLMVGHLGGRQSGRGRPPDWVREQSALRLTAIDQGSFAATLSLQRRDTRTDTVDYGPQALGTLLNWDGCEDSGLPRAVTDRLYGISSALSIGARLWLGSVGNRRKVEIRRVQRAGISHSEPERALLHGWLKEVNWDKGIAQLHDVTGSYTRLAFESELSLDMQRLATQFVEVRGSGRFNTDDDWARVQVDSISGTPSGREPFDLDAVLNDPNPKLFDPDRVVTASEPFDVDEFVRVIHEGRDVGREEASEWWS